jgi:hypothetical protein
MDCKISLRRNGVDQKYPGEPIDVDTKYTGGEEMVGVPIPHTPVHGLNIEVIDCAEIEQVEGKQHDPE